MANHYHSINNDKSSAGRKGKEDALGQSEQFLEFQERLSRVAPIDRPVLVLGERGTGKELAATRMHYLSKRWQGPLVALNCSALSPRKSISKGIVIHYLYLLL